MNPLILRNNWFKFKTLQNLPIVLEESMESILNYYKEKPIDHNIVASFWFTGLYQLPHAPATLWWLAAGYFHPASWEISMLNLMGVGVKQPVHWFHGDRAAVIQQGTNVWVGLLFPIWWAKHYESVISSNNPIYSWPNPTQPPRVCLHHGPWSRPKAM